MKRALSLLLTAALALSLLSGCGPKNTGTSSSASSSGGDTSSASSASSGDSSTSADYTLPKFMVLSGPTGVGAAKLMADAESAWENGGKTADGKPCPIAQDPMVVADNQQVNDALINGDTDIAAIATNVAATLSAKSEGAIQVLAVNTLGVLYILEKGPGISRKYAGPGTATD